MGLITIQNEQVAVVISTHGADLQSIKDSNGVERLWQGDPKYWVGHAPILFPVAGNFRDDVYQLGAKRYPMPKHGFVRQLEWRLETRQCNTATFLMDQKHEGFPFAYRLRACYTLLDSTLAVAYEVENLDSGAFYFSVGAHEGYATPEGIDAYTIEFDEEETLERFELSNNLLRRKPVILAENTRQLPLSYAYFKPSALVLRTLKSRGVTLKSKLHSREIYVAFPQHDTLVFWTLPGANYICIEPWCNAPDFEDADIRIEHKPGFIQLAPGEVAVRRHTVTVR